MKKLILIALTVCGLATGARAGLQPDGTLNGGTNNVLAAATNTYAGTVFSLVNTTDPIFEMSFAGVGATTSTTTFVWSCSLNQDRWQTNAWTVTITANGTATVTTNSPPPFRAPFWRVAQVWNTNASTPAFTNIAARVFTKTGI